MDETIAVPDDELSDYVSAVYVQLSGEEPKAYPATDCDNLDFIKKGTELD